MYAALTIPALVNDPVCDCTKSVNPNTFMPTGMRGRMEEMMMRRNSWSAKSVRYWVRLIKKDY